MPLRTVIQSIEKATTTLSTDDGRILTRLLLEAVMLIGTELEKNKQAHHDLVAKLEAAERGLPDDIPGSLPPS